MSIRRRRGGSPLAQTRFDGAHRATHTEGALLDGARNGQQARPRRRTVVVEGLETLFDGAQRVKARKRGGDAGRRAAQALRMRQLEKNLGVPEVDSIDELEHIAEQIRPETPVYKLSEHLLATGGLQAIFGLDGPNLIKTELAYNAGPHFDEYRRMGSSWTVWQSIKGSGLVRAAFLPKSLFEEYEREAGEVDIEDLDQRMVKLRANLGVRALDAADHTFSQRFSDGDGFLLWHGSTKLGAALPGVHDIRRDETTGVYQIFARSNLDEVLPEGFVRLH